MDVMKVERGGVSGGGERGEREMGKRRERDGDACYTIERAK